MDMKTELLVILLAPAALVFVAAVVEELRQGDGRQGSEGCSRTSACGPGFVPLRARGRFGLGLTARFAEVDDGHLLSPREATDRTTGGWARARRRHRRRWSQS